MLRELNLINREAILLMIEYAADEAATKAATKAVELYAKNNAAAEVENEARLLSKKKASAYLGISIPTLDTWRKSGLVVTTMVGGTRPRFKVSDLKAVLSRDDITE